MPHTFETQPIEVERHYTGLITQRNKLAIPIRIIGRRIIELYDALLGGNDCEITVRSTLQRRAGYIPFTSSVVAGIPLKWASFEPVAQNGTIYPILDTSTNVWYVPPSSGTPVNIFTKPSTSQTSMFAVGNYLYLGNSQFSQKWDTGSPQGTTNWGISSGSLAGAPVSQVPTIEAVSGSGAPWANPGNLASNVAFATVTTNNTSGFISQQLQGTGFFFSIPAAVQILGIRVQLNLGYTGGGLFAFPPKTATVQLLKNGTPIGLTRQFTSTLPAFGPQTILLGGSSDLWGTTWMPADINNSSAAGFGFQISVTSPNSAGTNWSVNSAIITIFPTGGPTVTLVTGTLTATQGFQYLTVFGNSNDGNISNPTLPSVSIKPVAQGVQIALTASTDPQVNQIRVFRTTDTGTGQVFFELPTSPYPNTTQNVVDNNPDTTLVVSNAIQQGSLAFSPPPTGLHLMRWYAGRMWGAVGNLLYFSAGPDNAPMGNGNSNWPPANVFELPTTIVKLIPISGGNGMLVVTLNGIHVVQGITNPGFTVNVWLSDVGARQENAVDSDGSNLYIFTSDRQFLQITASGDNELTQYVSDITDNFDPNAVYVCQHRSGSQDSRVFVSDGSTRILPYNLMSSCWEPIQTPVDGGGVGAIGSIEITPGIFKFLKGATSASQPLLQRDQNTFTDNGVQYTWSSLYGNIPVADPTQLANVDSLTLRMSNAGNLPTVQILPNEIAPTAQTPFITLPNPVDEPPEGSTPPQSYRAKKYYLSSGTAWTQMTHLQIQFSFGPSNQPEEIFTWGLFPNQSADQAVQPVPQVQGR